MKRVVPETLLVGALIDCVATYSCLPDHLAKGAKDNTVDIHTLWDILQDVLIPIWPKDRTTVSGQPIGDAWPLGVLNKMRGSDDFSASVQPFHKLTQWLTYSLMVPMERLLGFQWLNGQSLTALAEYRNGGLFVDLGVLSLKPHALERGLQSSGGPLPMFKAEDDVIVEWRAMTIVLLDIVYAKVLASMGGVHLTLAQFLEAGTWKSGRRVAAQLRPETKSSPILIDSDGTVF